MADFFNVGFGKDDYYNVSVSLKVIQCAEVNTSSETRPAREESIFASWDFALSEFLEPWSSNFGDPFTQDPDQYNQEAQITNCNETVERTLQFSVYPLAVLDWLFYATLAIVFLTLMFFGIKTGILFIRSIMSKRKPSGKQTSKVAPMSLGTGVANGLVTSPDRQQVELIDFDPSTFVKLPPSVRKDLPADRKGCHLDKGDVAQFLSQTLDLLNTGLNRVLWKTSSSAGSGSVVASPSLGRRWSSNLGTRTSSTTSLTLRRSARSATSLSSMGEEEPMTLDSWDEYLESLQVFGWRQGRVPRISRSKVGGETLQQMMSFLERNLSMDGGHWRAACMVTSYMLKLMEKELQRIPNASSVGLKFVNFVSVGSTTKGTKTGAPSEFDILMVLQPTCSSLQEAMVGGEVDNLAAGKTALVLTESGLGLSKRFVKELRLQDSKKCCMSTRQTCFTAHGLLDSAMAEVSSRGRKLSEKLPFRIQKMESRPTFSRIILDTKPIKNIGFSVDEITVNIIPAVCIADGGLQRLPLYAVPDWDRHSGGTTRPLSVPKRNNGIESEFAWSLCTAALEEAYLAAIEQRMRLSAVDSCHLACLQVMKTMLGATEVDQASSATGSDVLGYWQETIINFMLLERAPEMWSFDRLTDRLSDAIIFLKQALQNQRLPHFFIGNPHLLKQFPYLKVFPWLSGDRQINLMSSLTEANSGKVVKDIEESILKFPLGYALNKNYSSEMWEYEFFVFN